MKVAGVFFLFSLSFATSVFAKQHAVDDLTGVESWQFSVDGVTVSLTQILPDQVRAFYVNRGFEVEVIEPYALSCVFMTVLRNDAARGVARYRLTDWRVMTSGGDRPPLSTEDWMNQLGEHESGNAAMLAFRWAQFPAEQAYQPGGDWNQGMLSVGLAPGATFDLNTSWHVDGQQFTGVLNNVRCARENH